MAEEGRSRVTPSCRIPASGIRNLHNSAVSAISRKNKGKLTEEQVGTVDDPPANEATDGRQVDQPTEDGDSTAGDGHEGEEGEKRLSARGLSLRRCIRMKEDSRRRQLKLMEDHPP
jgi:hypothetical protein